MSTSMNAHREHHRSERSTFGKALSSFSRKTVALGVGLALAFSASPVMAQSKAEGEGVGKLGAIIGKAFIIRDGQKLPAQKGMAVFASDALATEPKAVVKILFADGGSFMAFENSSVKIEEYAVKKQGDKVSLKSAFDIAKGKVRFFVKPGENRNNDATYKTKNAVMGIRGTSGFIDTTGGNTQLVVTTGKVAVSNPANPSMSVLVPANHMTQVVGLSLPSEPKVAPAELLSSLKSSADQVPAGSTEVESEQGSQPTNSEAPAKQENQEKQDRQDEQGKTEGQDKKESPKSGSSEPSKESGANDSKGNNEPAEPAKSERTEKSEKADASDKKSGAAPERNRDSESQSAKSEAKDRPAERTPEKKPDAPTANARSEAPRGPGSAEASPGASPGAPAKPSAPAEPAAVKKVTVFSQDGSSSVAVTDQSMSRIATKVDTGALPQPAPRAAPIAPAAAALPAAQVSGAAAAVQQVQNVTSGQKIQEQIQTSVTKAVEQTTSVVEAAKAAPIVTPPPPVAAPTSKSVKVKIVMPTQ